MATLRWAKANGKPRVQIAGIKAGFLRFRMSPEEVVMTSIVIDIETRCWNWIGTLADGYGRVRIGKKFVRAHRLCWQLFRGQIPDGLVMDHLCQNKACCNPDHLEPVTYAENNRRAWLPGGPQRSARSNLPFFAPNRTLERGYL